MILFICYRSRCHFGQKRRLVQNYRSVLEWPGRKGGATIGGGGDHDPPPLGYTVKTLTFEKCGGHFSIFFYCIA